MQPDLSNLQLSFGTAGCMNQLEVMTASWNVEEGSKDFIAGQKGVRGWKLHPNTYVHSKSLRISAVESSKAVRATKIRGFGYFGQGKVVDP